MRDRQKKNALCLMKGIYRTLLGIALEGREPAHPLLAEKAGLLSGSRSPRKDALELTQEFMRELALNPPGLGRMRNLIGKVPRFS
jgi:hypothetical protein